MIAIKCNCGFLLCVCLLGYLFVVFLYVPNVKWKDVGGLENVKKSILDTVHNFSASFQRLDGRLPSLPIQGATLASSGVGTTLQNNPLNDTQLSVSKPTPFDADQRYSRLQHDGLVSRREKSMTHLQEDKQQLRRCSSGAESLGFGKCNNYMVKVFAQPHYSQNFVQSTFNNPAIRSS